MYSFQIKGDIVPYVRMTRRGKFVLERPMRYMASQDAIRYQCIERMREQGWEMLPSQTRLFVKITVFPARKVHHKQDLDNILKAILDAMQGVVFSNDLWVDQINISRAVIMSVEDEPFATVVIGILSESTN